MSNGEPNESEFTRITRVGFARKIALVKLSMK